MRREYQKTFERKRLKSNMNAYLNSLVMCQRKELAENNNWISFLVHGKQNPDTDARGLLRVSATGIIKAEKYPQSPHDFIEYMSRQNN